MKKLINFILNLFRRKKKEQQTYEKYFIKAKDSDSLYEINVHRLSLGLPPLKIASQEVFDIVGEHATWLLENATTAEEASKKGHWFSESRFQAIRDIYGENTRVGEVYCYNMSTPKAEVYAWSVSKKGHKEILEGDFTHVVTVSEGKHRTAIFYKLK